jgi:Protein of unknown function (DUF3592)
MSNDLTIVKRARNIAFLVAMFFLVPACYLAITSILLIRIGVITQGHVKEVLPAGASSSKSAPRIRIEFNSKTGEAIQFVGSIERQLPHDVGQNVEVLYDPRNPSKAILNTRNSLWRGAYSFGILGCFFLGFAYLMQTGLNRSKAPENKNLVQ